MEGGNVGRPHSGSGRAAACGECTDCSEPAQPRIATGTPARGKPSADLGRPTATELTGKADSKEVVR